MSINVKDIDFQTALDSIVAERRLMPLITAAEKNGFPDFTVSVKGYQVGGRPHDGWWHPSSCSTWGARKLFLYLARPDLVIPEEFDVNSIEAVTSGTFWHEYLQNLLMLATDVLVAPEVQIISAKYRVRGHADGELADDEYWGKELLEIKTINRYKFRKVTSEAELREINPEYYGQAQTYLALRFGIGVGRMRFLVIDPSYPFPKNEFTVDANAGWQRRRLALYAETWELVQAHQRGEDVELPQACCSVGSKTALNCEVRYPCPVGRTS